MGSGNLSAWEIASGGETGSICMDASAATAIATGLRCGLIDVHDDTVFTQLLAEDVNTGTGFDFRVQNQLPAWECLTDSLLSRRNKRCQYLS